MRVTRVRCASCEDSLMATTFWSPAFKGHVCLECRNLMTLFPPSDETVARIKARLDAGKE